ncbi:MAG: rhodanese-like domain-containing protein [Ignavibacteriae bacterium]|nr:rhodanese-like domain-containing protein [Ignavibacteriota bacterium]
MQEIQTITASELKAQLANDNDLVLLDVREPSEHAEKNISNSLLIPLGEIPARISELEPYKNRKIIVYCRSGNRSGQACAYLGQHGYNVTNLSGGMLKW